MSAQPIRCDTGADQNIAVMLITNLQGGTVFGLCGACAPDYLEGVAKVFRDALAITEAPPADDGAAAATGDGARKRTRPRTRHAEPQGVPTGADDQPPQPSAPDAPAD